MRCGAQAEEQQNQTMTTVESANQTASLDETQPPRVGDTELPHMPPRDNVTPPPSSHTVSSMRGQQQGIGHVPPLVPSREMLDSLMHILLSASISLARVAAAFRLATEGV